jgi:glycosyltransferase involved in cell wall biosynthesis
MLGQRSDVTRLLQAADLFIFPSRYEGFAFAVLEAHVAELPVIVSDGGPLPEVVTDREDGLIVPVGDAGALAEATVWALSHPAEMAAMAAAGRRRVLRDFTLTSMAAQTLALLKDDPAHPPSSS